MKTFVQPGIDLNFVASAAIASGDVVVAGSLVGISTGTYASGEVGVMELQGVHKVAKAAATAFTQGAKVYFNTVTKLAVTASGADIVFLGYAAEAVTAVQALTSLKVLLARPGE